MGSAVIFGVGVVVTALVVVYYVMLARASQQEAEGPKNWK